MSASTDSCEASVFEQFHSQPGAVDSLSEALDRLCYTDSGCWESLTLERCNADWKYGNGGLPFSKASVEVKSNTARDDNIYRFGLMFQKYREELHAYLDDPSMEPEDKTAKLLFAKLLAYILDKDQHAVLQAKIKELRSECEVAVVLAEHLFTKLSLSPYYMLDNKYTHSRSVQACPCGCGADISHHFGDTSIGNSKVWHGNLDIMLGDLPVIIKEDKSHSQEENSEVLKLKEELEDPGFTNQIIPQTIVFSFLQKKYHPEFSSFLIPTIGVTKSFVLFYLYDSEKDILLRSPCFPFISTGEVSMFTILAIWFVVNYKFLCTGIDMETHFGNVKKANFFKLASNVLTIYQKEMSFCGIQSSGSFVSFEPNHVSSVSVKEDPPSKKFKKTE